MEYITSFKGEFDWMKRLSKTQYLKSKYPDRIPVIIDRGNTYTPKPSNHRFLVPNDITVGQFHHIVRKHIPTLEASKAIFIYVGDSKVLPVQQDTMAKLYSEHHDKDNFLYIVISVESTFG